MIPLVSVIVPVYNVEKYIGRCAESLMKQTLQNMEFIFVDDCSPDESIEVLNQVIQRYPNRAHQVKIVRHDRNQGFPFARSSGIKPAEGEYVAHCDSDDWVDTGIYQK
ncbi:MAG: glycosyltransferase family 2 protein, partial [Bacteroidales bacterium]|nr:glycosyltransferase family 2 protein [Bacteroidales bacterium]